MAAKNGYVRMRANTEHDVIATCGQQLKRLKGFRNPWAPLRIILIAPIVRVLLLQVSQVQSNVATCAGDVRSK